MKKNISRILPARDSHAAPSGLLTTIALGAMLAVSAHADMYHSPTNSEGGVRAQSTITSITAQGTNTTVCWYGMQGWYNVEAALIGGTNWNSVGRTAAADHPWCLTVANPDPTNSYQFRLNQTNAYAGAGACAGCHGDKFAEWSGTRHSVAISSLAAIGMDKNPACVVCHSVGFGQPNGYDLTPNTAHLKNVGCETCHGPAATHKYSDHNLIRPAVSLDPKICGGCHQDSHHPTYEEYESSPHAEVLDDISYGFTGGVYVPDVQLSWLGGNVVAAGNLGSSNGYGFYLTTNANLTLKTNYTTGIVHSGNGPGTVYTSLLNYDPGLDRAASCGICHSAGARMAMIQDWEARQEGHTNALSFPSAHDSASWGAACATCHDPHSYDHPAQLRNPMRSTNYYTMPTTTDKRTNYTLNAQGQRTGTNVVFYSAAFASMYDPEVQVCAQCHNSRGARWDGRSYGLVTTTAAGDPVTNRTNVPIYAYTTNTYGAVTYIRTNIVGSYQTNIVITPTNTAVSVALTTNSSFSRPPHPSPQYNILIGIIQDDYMGGTNSPVTHNHTRAPNGCANCHVPIYSNGSTNITGHTFALDTKGCIASGCHGSVPSEFRSTQTGNSNRVNVAVSLLNRWALSNGPSLFGNAYTNYMQNGWEYTTPGSLGSTNYRGPSSADQLKIPDGIKQARFDLYEVLGDGSWGIHNLTYISRLLSDATNKVNSALIGATNSAYFTADATTGYAPFTVNFTSWGVGITNYSWEFGDGGISTAANPSYAYARSGTNTVKLTVISPSGTATYTRTNYIRTYTRPVISFAANPLSGEAPFTVTFTNTSTSTNSVSAWRWTLNGVNVTTNATVLPYTFSTPGSYVVALRATTPVGTLTVTSNAFVIGTTNPAYFVGSATSGYGPVTNNFQCLGVGATSYSWTFGDGGTSTNANPTYVYNSQGTYTVSLAVTTAGGPKTWTRTNYVAVYDRPVVSFTASPTSGPAPLSVGFVNTSSNTNSVTTWRWTINGQNITTNVPVYTYVFTNVTPASYSISLRATTPLGNITTTSNAYITVTAP